MARFETTRWSVVIAAGDSRTLVSRNALAALCEAYWQPLYVFVRSRGIGPEEAQDLVQEFLARLMERDAFKAADRERGKFRTFLLASFKHFLSDEWDRARALKRGGGTTPLQLDFDSFEAGGIPEPVHGLTPDRLYDRQWALATLEAVLGQLRNEYVSAAKEDVFDALRGTLTGENVAAYAELGPRLGMTEGALKAAAHRMRQRYRLLLRKQVSETVASGDETEDELKIMLGALSV